MVRRALLRSVLQLTGLCLAVVLLLPESVQGAAEECDQECYNFSCTERAEMCALKCGATVTWEYQWTATHHWLHEIQEWPGPHYHTDYHDIFNYEYSSGIESFSCDQVGQTSSCSCAY